MIRDEAGDASSTDTSSDGLQVLGISRFSLDGEIHKLVTFLNQTLKDRGLIFGISKDSDELTMKIYDAGSSKQS